MTLVKSSHPNDSLILKNGDTYTTESLNSPALKQAYSGKHRVVNKIEKNKAGTSYSISTKGKSGEILKFSVPVSEVERFIQQGRISKLVVKS